jgi:hypothetical protein
VVFELEVGETVEVLFLKEVVECKVVPGCNVVLILPELVVLPHLDVELFPEPVTVGNDVDIEVGLLPISGGCPEVDGTPSFNDEVVEPIEIITV